MIEWDIEHDVAGLHINNRKKILKERGTVKTPDNEWMWEYESAAVRTTLMWRTMRFI